MSLCSGGMRVSVVWVLGGMRCGVGQAVAVGFGVYGHDICW